MGSSSLPPMLASRIPALQLSLLVGLSATVVNLLLLEVCFSKYVTLMSV